MKAATSVNARARAVLDAVFPALSEGDQRLLARFAIQLCRAQWDPTRQGLLPDEQELLTEMRERLGVPKRRAVQPTLAFVNKRNIGKPVITIDPDDREGA